MKKIYLFLICAFPLLFSSLNSTSCVDYHPDSVRVIISGDSSCNLEIRITNLQMFGGNPNQFCSCGVISSYDLGPDKPFFIDYVVFVDSITNVPVAGFDAFNFLPASSTSWESVDAQSFDWSGFVALVNSSGIVAGQGVDLVIRGHYEHQDCEYDMVLILYGEISILDGGGFGTDEWSDAQDELALSHNDITYFDDVVEFEDIEYNNVTPDYFEFLDNLLLNQTELNEIEVLVYPNPTNDKLWVQLPSSSLVEILDTQGRVMLTHWVQQNAVINISELPTGLYIFQQRNQESSFRIKFIKE
ncbi:MAG: T9SS type A sorting domain-containing protein [Flavobacteriales bacterium]|nr:T9SS type A sorting domain-containing protein [Flavobacteriales bacterium]